MFRNYKVLIAFWNYKVLSDNLSTYIILGLYLENKKRISTKSNRMQKVQYLGTAECRYNLIIPKMQNVKFGQKY